jgi:hypothetical protein
MMKYVFPAAVALSLAAAGFAQAQTSSTHTGATTTTNAVGTGTSATNGSSAGTTANSANTATPPSTAGSPNSATTGTRALGTAPVGSPTTTPNDNRSTATRNSDGNTNNAVSTRPQNNPGAPHPGANSFTEGQARSRIQDKGFSQVTDLKKDNQGIWRGHAMKDGKQTNVALDYQGNVVTQ